MAIIITSNGTALTETEIEFRKKLILDSHSVYCPISHEVLSVMKGEILFVQGQDHFISDTGITKLKGIFGNKFIEDRIVTYD